MLNEKDKAKNSNKAESHEAVKLSCGLERTPESLFLDSSSDCLCVLNVRATVVTKICRFNYALIFLSAHSKELLHHNQMFLFLRV